MNNGEIRYYIEAIIDQKLFTDFFHKTTAEFMVKAQSNIPLPNMLEVSFYLNGYKNFTYFLKII